MKNIYFFIKKKQEKNQNDVLWELHLSSASIEGEKSSLWKFKQRLLLNISQILTQIDSWQCQWMPDYPQIGHQESSYKNIKQDFTIMNCDILNIHKQR